MIHADPHPLLDAIAFTSSFPMPLGQLDVVQDVRRLFSLEAESRMTTDAQVRLAVREASSPPGAPSPRASTS